MLTEEVGDIYQLDYILNRSCHPLPAGKVGFKIKKNLVLKILHVTITY